MTTTILRLMHIAAIAVFVTCLLLIALAPDQAHAGVGGAAFDEVWDTLVDWTQGTLGKIVAGAMVLRIGRIIGLTSRAAGRSVMRGERPSERQGSLWSLPRTWGQPFVRVRPRNSIALERLT